MFDKLFKKDKSNELLNDPGMLFLAVTVNMDNQEKNLLKKEEELGVEFIKNSYSYDCFYICFVYGVVDCLSKNEKKFMQATLKYTNSKNIEDGKLSMTKDAFRDWYKFNRLPNYKENEQNIADNDCAEIYNWFVTSLEEKNENVQDIILKGYDYGIKIGEQSRNNEDTENNYDFFEIIHQDFNKPFWNNLDFTCNDYLNEQINGERKVKFVPDYYESQFNNPAITEAIKKNDTSLFELFTLYIRIGIVELDEAMTLEMRLIQKKNVSLGRFFRYEKDEYLGASIYIGLAYGCLESVMYHKEFVKKNFYELLKKIFFEELERQSSNLEFQKKHKELFEDYVEIIENESEKDRITHLMRETGRKAFIKLHHPLDDPKWSNLGLYNSLKKTLESN